MHLGTASVEPVIGTALRGPGGKCLRVAGNGASGRSYCAPDPVSVQWIFGNSWLAKDRAPAIGYWFTGARRTDRSLTARALELGDPAQDNEPRPQLVSFMLFVIRSTAPPARCRWQPRPAVFRSAGRGNLPLSWTEPTSSKAEAKTPAHDVGRSHWGLGACRCAGRALPRCYWHL